MARCPQCDLVLSRYSENCPRCGRPLPRLRLTLHATIVAAIAVLIFLALWSGGRSNITGLMPSVTSLTGAAEPGGQISNAPRSSAPKFDANRVAEELRKESQGTGLKSRPRSIDDAAEGAVERATMAMRACIRSHVVDAYRQGVYGANQAADFFLKTCGVPFISVVQNAGGNEEFARSLLTLIVMRELSPEEYQEGLERFRRALEKAN
jgi:hypothetical protein